MWLDICNVERRAAGLRPECESGGDYKKGRQHRPVMNPQLYVAIAGCNRLTRSNGAGASCGNIQTEDGPKETVSDVKTAQEERPPKRVLALPDLDSPKRWYSNLASRRGQLSYDRAITDFVDWSCSESASHSTVQWFCDTGSFSNRSSTQP